MSYNPAKQLHSASIVHVTPEAESLIAYMARVSSPANQSNEETSPRLIKYLIDHRHWSPFEMVNMCVEVYTTRSIASQILRHRSFSFQEFSQRYAKVDCSLTTAPSFRRQDLKNRQNSIDDLDEQVLEEADRIAAQSLVTSLGTYERLIELGVAKECARDVLPLCTPTTMYMNGTVRSWLHYVDLRTSEGTQREHRMIASQVMQLLFMSLPNVSAAMWPEARRV